MPWAEGGCRLLDARLPRHVWLADAAHGLELSACVVLAAVVEALDGARVVGTTMLTAAAPEAVEGAAVFAHGAEPEGDGWDRWRSCAPSP